MSPMGCAGVEPTRHPVARAFVLHYATLAATDDHGPVGEEARLGRAADAAAHCLFYAPRSCT